MEYTEDHFRKGKLAYGAYCKQTGGVSLVSGDKLPEFDVLKLSIREAWAAAALAVSLDAAQGLLKNSLKILEEG